MIRVMTMYQSFAYLYDQFMSEVPYKKWVDYIEKIWEKHDAKPELVLDLACGTGNVSIELAKRGYDMTGVDLSFEMLDVAREKCRGEDVDSILFLQQDMREFELYGTVNSIVCICDGINYLLEEEDVETTMKLVDNYLHPDGLFIFDVNTAYKYKNVLGNQIFTDIREDCAYIWENDYDEEECINTYGLTLFNEEKSGLYRKYEEEHYQRAYTIDFMKKAIVGAGLKLEGVYDAFTFNPPTDESERVYFVAREIKKECK